MVKSKAAENTINSMRENNSEGTYNKSKLVESNSKLIVENRKLINENKQLKEENLSLKESSNVNYTKDNSVNVNYTKDNSVYDTLQDFWDNWFDFIGSLEQEKLLQLVNILTDYLLLAIIVNNLIAWYGSYLIAKFNLVDKYPFLKKVILYRLQIKSYYFKYSLTLAIIALLSHLILNIIAFFELY